MSGVPPLAARLAPPSVWPSYRARHLLARNIRVTKRYWLVIFSGFFEPLFYLFSIGVGIGQLVGDVVGPAGPVPYALFVAPALLAASAMNGAVFEAFNVFFKLKYGKIYDAILATPVGPGDVAIGEIGWSLFRGALYAAAFLVVTAVMGLIPSWWGLLALPAAVLIGFAFGAVGVAATTYMRSWTDFDFVTLAIVPLFLFSATFYPLDVYPEAIRPLIQLSPLYHGVALIRSLMLGVGDVSLVGHVAFLVTMGIAGLLVAGRRIQGLLLR